MVSAATAQAPTDEDPPDENPFDILTATHTLLYEGEFEEAERQALALAERDFGIPAMPTLFLLQAAEAQRHMGKFRAGRLTLSECESRLDLLTPEQRRAVRFRIALEYANNWMDLGVLDEAYEHISVARELEGSGDAAFFAKRYADYLFATFQNQRAEELLQQASESHPDDPVLLGYLGVARAQIEALDPGIPRRSEHDLRRAVELMGERDGASRDRTIFKLYLAERLIHRSAFADARELLDQVEPEAASSDHGSVGGWHGELLLRVLSARLLLARGGERAELERELHELLLSLHRMLDQWRAASRPDVSVGFLHQGSRIDAVGEAIRLIVALDPSPAGLERALDLVLEVQLLGSFSRNAGTTAVSLGEVRDLLLGKDDGVLLYLPGRERTHAFLVDRDSIAHFDDLPANPTVREATRLLIQELRRRRTIASADARDRHRIRLDELSADLASLLLPPRIVAEIAEWRGATIVGADLMLHPPFAALPIESGQPLGARVAVGYLPSLPMGIALARRLEDEARAPSLALLVAQRPSPRHGLPEIPFEAETARELEELYGSERTLIASGLTRESIGELDLTDTAVVHLTMHGTHVTGIDRGTALLLEPVGDLDDGVLLGAELDQHLSRLSGLVVVEACRAGLGQERRGDDRLTHLGGMFLERGASAVALSAADLEYHASTAMLLRTHRRLVAGATPAEALRAAYAERIDELDGLARYYDAEFHVVGLAHRSPISRDLRPPASRTTRRTVTWVFGAVVAALIAAGVVTRRREHTGS